MRAAQSSTARKDDVYISVDRVEMRLVAFDSAFNDDANQFVTDCKQFVDRGWIGVDSSKDDRLDQQASHQDSKYEWIIKRGSHYSLV